VEFILNNTVHSALGVTPNAMMFGYMSPNRYDFPTLIANAETAELNPNAQAYVRKLQEQLSLLRDTAEVAQKAADATKDRRYNTTEPTEFTPGDFVLLRRNHDERAPKLAPLLLGPYKVIECPAAQVYKIQSLYDPSITRTVHHRQLAVFNLRTDVDDTELARLAEYDNGEQIPMCINTHTGFNKRDILFNITWMDGSTTDEPWHNVEGNDKILEYIRTHPELGHLLRPQRRRE
jgi:hypothetical protein